MDITFVVPTLDEESTLLHMLEPLARRVDPRNEEILVVDGCSRDGTVALARSLGVRVLETPRGRSKQMNAGACEARGRLLVFAHADTRFPPRRRSHAGPDVDAQDRMAAGGEALAPVAVLPEGPLAT